MIRKSWLFLYCLKRHHKSQLFLLLSSIKPYTSCTILSPCVNTTQCCVSYLTGPHSLSVHNKLSAPQTETYMNHVDVDLCTGDRKDVVFIRFWDEHAPLDFDWTATVVPCSHIQTLRMHVTVDWTSVLMLALLNKTHKVPSSVLWVKWESFNLKMCGSDNQ